MQSSTRARQESSNPSWRTGQPRGAGTAAGPPGERRPEIALAQAREQSANAEQRVVRQRALKSQGVVTAADSERVELEYREAELSLRKAQRDYDLTVVVAPFGGVVTVGLPARSAWSSPVTRFSE